MAGKNKYRRGRGKYTGGKAKKRNMERRRLLNKLRVAAAARKTGGSSSIPVTRTVELLPSQVNGKEEHKIMFMAALGLIPKTESRVDDDKAKKQNLAAAAPLNVSVPSTSKSLEKSDRKDPPSAQSLPKERKRRTRTRSNLQKLPASSSSASIPTRSTTLDDENDADAATEPEVVDLVSSDEEEASREGVEQIETLVDPTTIMGSSELDDSFSHNRERPKRHFPFMSDALQNFQLTGKIFNLCSWNK